MRLLILFMTLALVLPAHGQTELSGHVYDALDSTAITGVTVDCLSAADSTISLGKSISDGTGKFTITPRADQDVLLKITGVGYAPYYMTISGKRKRGMDVGGIYLRQVSGELEEISVSANRNRIDKMWVTPTREDVNASGDIYDLLATLNLRRMRVDVLNKSVTVSDKPPLWKVNGVPKETSDIVNLRPQDVRRIEYSDLASIRERDAGYGGVINIILKQKDDGGTLEANAMSAFTTGFANGGAQAAYHKGKDELTVNYSASYRRYHKWTKDENSLYVAPEETIVRDIHGLASRFGYLSQNINVGYTHLFDESTTLSVTLRNPLYYQREKPKSMLQDGIYRETNSSFHGYTPSLDVFYGMRLSDNDRLEVNLVGTYGVEGKSDYTTRDFKEGEPLREYDMPADTRRRSLIGELFYLRDIGANRFRIGAQGLMGKNTNTYHSPSDQRDELSERNLYAYAQWDGDLGKFQYTLSTGLKHNKMDNGTARSYWSNQSLVTLSYSPNKEMFFRYYAVFYPTMPSLYALTSVTQRIDDLRLLTGNSSLKPAHNFYNSLLFSFARKKFSSDLTITYNYDAKPIFTRLDYDDAKRLFVQSYINGIHDAKLDFNYSASLKGLFSFMSVYGDIGYSRYWTKTEDVAHTLNNVYWDVTVQLYYRQFALSAYFMQPAKSLLHETISRDEKVSRIMLTWQKDHLTLTAAVFNPFTPKGSNYLDESLSKYNPGRSKVSIHDNGNMFTMGLAWNFSFGKSGHKARRSLNNADAGNSLLRVSP